MPALMVSKIVELALCLTQVVPQRQNKKCFGFTQCRCTILALRPGARLVWREWVEEVCAPLSDRDLILMTNGVLQATEGTPRLRGRLSHGNHGNASSSRRQFLILDYPVSFRWASPEATSFFDYWCLCFGVRVWFVITFFWKRGNSRSKEAFLSCSPPFRSKQG